LFTNSCIQAQKDWSNYLVRYDITKNDEGLEFLWSKENLFADYGAMSAAKEKVFIFGNIDQPTNLVLLAFNSKDGTLLWRTSPPYYNTLTSLKAMPSALYVGSNGNGHITAYNLDDGQTLWSTSMPGARYSIVLEIVDNIIYVVSSSGYHLIQADNGEVIETFSKPLSSEDVQKMLKLASTTAQQINPEYFSKDIFTRDKKLVLSDSGILQVFDRQTGKLLWEKAGVIGDIAVTESTVYLLSLEYKLLGLDLKNGNVINEVQFSQTAPAITDSQYGFIMRYYVAVDENANLLYAFLGNGGQLFAFKIKE
jgi:outer membrane protein assembly factor BamB